MTLETAASIWAAISLAWATFALGLICGVFLTRKDASNDGNSDTEKDENGWHTVGGK